jgi:transcriptional regulator with XRE-family HTH domain
LNGKKLKAKMKQHNLTVEQLAKKIGRSGRHIYHLLADDHAKPNWEPIHMLFETMEKNNDHR